MKFQWGSFHGGIADGYNKSAGKQHDLVEAAGNYGEGLRQQQQENLKLEAAKDFASQMNQGGRTPTTAQNVPIEQANTSAPAVGGWGSDVAAKFQSLNYSSPGDLKTNKTPVDEDEALNRVRQLPSWQGRGGYGLRMTMMPAEESGDPALRQGSGQALGGRPPAGAGADRPMGLRRSRPASSGGESPDFLRMSDAAAYTARRALERGDPDGFERYLALGMKARAEWRKAALQRANERYALTGDPNVYREVYNRGVNDGFSFDEAMPTEKGWRIRLNGPEGAAERELSSDDVHRFVLQLNDNDAMLKREFEALDKEMELYKQVALEREKDRLSRGQEEQKHGLRMTRDKYRHDLDVEKGRIEQNRKDAAPTDEEKNVRAYGLNPEGFRRYWKDKPSWSGSGRADDPNVRTKREVDLRRAIHDQAVNDVMGENALVLPNDQQLQQIQRRERELLDHYGVSPLDAGSDNPADYRWLWMN